MKVIATVGEFDIWTTNEENVYYFEHHHHGDEYGGHVWLVEGEIVDYDGVYTLPNSVNDYFVSLKEGS